MTLHNIHIPLRKPRRSQNKLKPIPDYMYVHAYVYMYKIGSQVVVLP